MGAPKPSIESIDYSIMAKNLQASVLRRAMESNQRDLVSLSDDRHNHFLQIDNRLVANHSKLPRLPEEIISKIFSVLYEIESGDSWERTTFYPLLQDISIPEEWKKVILKGIPIVVADTSDADLQKTLLKIKRVVGPSPRLFTAHELDDVETFPPWTSVSVLIRTENWPSATELHSLCQVRWKRLFIDHNSRGDQDQQDFIMALFQRPGFLRKLADVEHLEMPWLMSEYFHVINPLTPRGQNLNLEIKVLKVDDEKAFKIRTARLPLPLLSTLRPILSRITDLELAIQPFVTNFNLAIDAIRPFSCTLINFVLWGPSEYWPFRVVPLIPLLEIRQETSVQFPLLERLVLSRISERNCRDMLSIFQCPQLEEMSIEMAYLSESRFEAIYDATQYVSIDFLHEMLPSIKCLHIHTDGTHVSEVVNRYDIFCGTNVQSLSGSKGY